MKTVILYSAMIIATAINPDINLEGCLPLLFILLVVDLLGWAYK